jgi:surface antigen
MPMAAALSALVLAACAGDPGPPQTGSIAYSATQSSKVAAAGVLGNGLGTNLEERDRQRAYAAEMQALELGEPGEPVGWRGDSGRYGTVVPGAYYETRGVRCRDYSHTIYIDRRPQTARATACRNPDGTWSPVV